MTKASRRALVLSGASLVIAPHARARPQQTQLQRMVHFGKAAQAAATLAEPLVLLVSLPGCPFCEIVRRNYLVPMRAESNLQAWQLDINDAKTALTDFDGKPTTPAAWSRARALRTTPTLLFLSSLHTEKKPLGHELAERLQGFASADFYGAYLDDRLQTARQALRREL
jgi:hypothetical protein